MSWLKWQIPLGKRLKYYLSSLSVAMLPFMGWLASEISSSYISSQSETYIDKIIYGIFDWLRGGENNAPLWSFIGNDTPLWLSFLLVMCVVTGCWRAGIRDRKAFELSKALNEIDEQLVTVLQRAAEGNISQSQLRDRIVDFLMRAIRPLLSELGCGVALFRVSARNPNYLEFWDDAGVPNCLSEKETRYYIGDSASQVETRGIKGYVFAKADRSEEHEYKVTLSEKAGLLVPSDSLFFCPSADIGQTSPDGKKRYRAKDISYRSMFCTSLRGKNGKIMGVAAFYGKDPTTFNSESLKAFARSVVRKVNLVLTMN
jgi:hypothetical protein